MNLGKSKIIIGLGIMLMAAGCAGCGASRQQKTENTETEDNAAAENAPSNIDPLGESAADSFIDFDMLQEKNPDIFAWLYIPGTKIDMPILQSPVSDDYYITHDVTGEENNMGALYTEMPNLMNMCDFNTIIHGNDLDDDAPFMELHQFEDSDFFEEHEEFYIYMPDNVLTYEIFTAYYDDDSDILRRHDYTTYAGCEDHLNDIYGVRSMNKNFREGWEGLTPYHFLVTLNGKGREDGTQYVVIGTLTRDAAGQIDRVLYE